MFDTNNEDGQGRVSLVVMAAFVLSVMLGSYAGVKALTAMSEDEMGDVSGQEGITLDISIQSSFTVGEMQYVDNDGNGNTRGVVGIKNISPQSALDISGLTIDADGATTVGGTQGGAIVLGIPSVASGVRVGVVPGGDDLAFDGATTGGGNSMGEFGMGDISGVSGTTIEVAAH